MEPIVSPWFIYLLFKVDTFVTFAWVIGILALAGGSIAFLPIDDMCREDVQTKYLKYYRRMILLSIGVSMIFLALITPSKNTIIAMYVSQQVTYDKVGKYVEITKNIKNTLKQDIVDIIREINDTHNKCPFCNTVLEWIDLDKDCGIDYD